MTTQTCAEKRLEAQTMKAPAAQALDELADLNSPIARPTDPLVLTGALTIDKDATA